MKIPHIVAPGGSYAKAMVASHYGAEEVYVGVPFTSLRMRQNKIKDFEELNKTVRDLHAHGTKALLTMNIFPRNQDIKIFEETVEKIADVGADAIIFSDPGTFKTIRKYMPDVPLHLSTQTSTLNYESVQFRYDLGVKRIVLARELSIQEVAEIKRKVPQIELEVFVHGAMCMSYSGRCLLGDYLSGRPGNKGECSHGCRFKYRTWLEEERRPGKFFQLENDAEGSYILSSKDLCTIDKLAEILPYVDALKIEGRSKSQFYVGAVVKAYKHVRDCILEGKIPDEDIKNLVNVIPHRTYWDGFLFNPLNQCPEAETLSPLTKGEGLKGGGFVATERQMSQTLTSAGPLFNRNYFGTFTGQFIQKNSKKYFQICPKEVINIGMKLKYISPKTLGAITIVDMVNDKGEKYAKATCNTGDVYVLTDQKLSGREILYE